MSFDPLSSPQPLNAADRWSSLHAAGQFTAPVLTAIHRIKLTLTCQFCGTRYQRQGGLVAHLLQSHPALWNNSQETLRFLLQTVIAHTGCLCNPQVHQNNRTHVCTVVRQLAMAFHQSELEVLVPTVYSPQLLDAMLVNLGNTEQIQRLRVLLHDRQFSSLWQDLDVLILLRTRCVICGGFYHATQMMYHLLTMHHDACMWAAQITYQLSISMQSMQPQDYQCQFCQLIFNLPHSPSDLMEPRERCLRLQAHFHSGCPVLRQIALLLLPTHGLRGVGLPRPSADGQPASAGTNVPGHTQTGARKRRQDNQTPQGAQTRGARRSTTSTGVDTGRHEDGTTAPEPRAQPPDLAPSGLLRYLCPHPSNRNDAHHGHTGPGMEDESATEPGEPPMVDVTQPSPPRSPSRIADQSGATTREPARTATMGHRGGEADHLAGRVMGLHEVVAIGPTTHSHQADTHPDGSNGEAPESPDRSTPGQHARPTFSEPQDATRSHLAGLRTVGHIQRADGELSVGPHGHVVEEAPTGVLQTCPTAGRPPGQGQRTRQGETGEAAAIHPDDIDANSVTFQHRHDLRQMLTMLVLQNPGSLCYANSATLCYWWSCLSRVNFQYQDWGSQSATFLNLLQRDNTTMISLDEYEWFNQLIASWHDPDSQADSAEFTHRLLTWVGTPIVSNRWERRVHTSERTELHDSGDTYMPITLQLDMDMIADNEVSLESLVRLWHGELGMSAGLTDPSDLVVLHIDRLFHNDTGRLQKLHTVIRFCWLVQIPILQHDMPVRWEPYQLVAAFAHIGEAQGGHYQALLKTFPETTDLANPTMWLFCDDGREPQPRWTIPPQFEEGVTCFWLCRCNQVELHRLPSQVLVRQTTTDEALIAMLADPQTSRNGQVEG